MGVTLVFKQSPRERDRALRSTQAPLSMRHMVSDVVRTPAEAADLAQRMGGRGVRPYRPVMVERADGTRTMVVGDGVADASELSDLALAVLEKKPVDFDALRERGGQMRREDVGPKMREAFAARVERGKRNTRTDPAQHITAARRAGKVK